MIIEGLFAVPQQCAITALDGVDPPHVSIKVQEGSAYDLFLSRTLKYAQIVRGNERDPHDPALKAIAGIGSQMIEFVARNPTYRLIGEPFMQISQALGSPRSRARETISYLEATIDELAASGFVLAALLRSGHPDVTVPQNERGLE